MDFLVLGPLEVDRDGAHVRIGSRMQRRLLALLLVQGGDAVRAERVVDVLWGADPPPTANKGLHTYVSRLRRVLGDDVRIGSDANGYRLDLEGHELDSRRFEQLVSVARQRVPDEPAAAAADLAEALSLWRGPAYAEFADEDFARAEAVRLEEIRLAATEDAFAARLASGDTGVIPDLEAFATANPLRERPHAQLMTALDQAGRPSDALEVYQRVRNRLADEVGLEPSPTLQQLQIDILQQTTGHARTARDTGDDGDGSSSEPGGHEVGRDQPGGHEVGRDQPGDREPRRGEPPQQPAGNLPTPVTSFVGRRHETEAVRRLLERNHLVTLTGVGGVGKTRLALQAAAATATRYPDGVWWCELAPVDPDAVAHAVATVLDVHQQANQGIADSIVTSLAGKRVLLVFDNCEHLIEASARLVERILHSCPEVTVLSTSREPLTVGGEQVWHVPPLPLPSDRADDGADAPSARLFIDRAQAHLAGFTVDEATRVAITDICRQLDGLPLAIELAAALVPALEPPEIARRLGHRFRLLTHGPRTDPRHRSLAAVVEWSYQLLDAAEQHLFERLAVFTGGFTLTAAEGVCADEHLPAERIAALLTSLVSHSMVGVDRSALPARYRMLETLRQYAVQRLAERGEEAAIRARHAAWFVELAERADVDVRGPDEAEAVALLEAELANLRTAHRWALEHEEADLALRQVAALYVYARFRLRDEVFTWAEQATQLPTAADHPLHPMVMGVAAHGISNRGDLGRAREVAEQAIATAADTSGLFVPLRVLSTIALHEGRLDDCRHYAQRAIESARRDGGAYYLLWMQMHEGLALVYGGQREAGLEVALAQRAAGERLDNPSQRAWALYGHAEACGDEDPETALRLLEEVIALAEPVQARFLEGVARVAIASLLARHGSPGDALAAFPDIIRHWRRVGDWTHQWTTLRNLVPLLVRLDADEPAALLLGAQDAADTAAPAYGAEARRLAEARATLSSRLGTSACEALADRGGQLGGEQATELALESIAAILEVARR